MLLTKDKKTLLLYAIGNSRTSYTIPTTVTKIDDYSFSGTGYLKNLKIGNSVKTIGSGAFLSCRNLTSVSLGSKVQKISYGAFRECVRLKKISIPKSVKSVGEQAFFQCTRLSSVKVASNLRTIGYKAFDNTKWYKNQSNGMVYLGRVALKYKGTCPEKLTVKKNTGGVAAGAFEGQRKVKKIVLPSTIRRIGSKAFKNCTKLASVNIPNGVTAIGEETFLSCKALKKLTIPKTVKSISDCSVGFYFIPEGDDSYVRVSGFKIYGYKGTAAQKYAKYYNIPFVKL